MNSHILCDGEIIRVSDDDRVPLVIHLRLLPILAFAFALGLVAGFHV